MVAPEMWWVIFLHPIHQGNERRTECATYRRLTYWSAPHPPGFDPQPRDYKVQFDVYW